MQLTSSSHRQWKSKTHPVCFWLEKKGVWSTSTLPSFSLPPWRRRILDCTSISPLPLLMMWIKFVLLVSIILVVALSSVFTEVVYMEILCGYMYLSASSNVTWRTCRWFTITNPLMHLTETDGCLCCWMDFTDEQECRHDSCLRCTVSSTPSSDLLLVGASNGNARAICRCGPHKCWSCHTRWDGNLLN